MVEEGGGGVSWEVGACIDTSPQLKLRESMGNVAWVLWRAESCERLSLAAMIQHGGMSIHTHGCLISK